MSTFIKNNSCFIPLEQAKQWLLNQLDKEAITIDYFNYLASLLFVPVKRGEVEYVLTDDLHFCLRIFQLNSHLAETDKIKFYEAGNLFCDFLKISENTAIYLSDLLNNRTLPAYVRNLFYFSELAEDDISLEHSPSIFNLMGIVVVTYETSIKRYMQQASSRKKELDRIRKTSFINTASYMGNKKKIAGFIIEAMFPYISQRPIFLDLMCGSGAMSQAFAQIGPTYASDAENFCLLLAKIQGSGFSKERATRVLERIALYYQQHLKKLISRYNDQIDREASLYAQDWGDKNKVFSMYCDYVSQFPLYSSSYPVSDEICNLIKQYKTDVKKYPYTLFTLYFSNVYFGLLQCIQLDSLRYSIDQLEEEERLWALGALIVTTYQISSGHAGHFAQPKSVTNDNILSILSIRQRSAYHEFSKRLLCLAEESELCPNAINTISGPWEAALTFAGKELSTNTVVYLDAPYKRDEYSRYYHVLETMTNYDYPASELKGRIRSKKLGERFSSEFFTKTQSKVEKIFEKIIINVLRLGMSCVWSYSDNGDASIIEIIDYVKKNITCDVHLYGIPYKHHSQRRKHRSRSVVEYCIVFTRSNEIND